MPSLILTLIGPDRPGLVDSVAAVVKDQKANWLESRMSHLAGYFAGIVRIEVSAAEADNLVSRLESLEANGLTIVVRRDENAPTEEATPLVKMELVGNDRPGIVSEVSRVFAERNVNVEEFHTECTGAPNSGAILFRANALLRLPSDLSADALQQSLEQIAADLMVDIKVETN